jgi:Transposase DDE domain
VTNVLEKKALSDKSVGVLYEMRWGVEVFFRSLKQTLEKRRMLSRTPEAAKCELTWALLGLWLLGLMAAVEILARGGDPLGWSAAKARARVRRSMRRALTRRHADRGLGRDLAQAVKDGYVRRGGKKARDWPHKKTEKPPGEPKIRDFLTPRPLARTVVAAAARGSVVAVATSRPSATLAPTTHTVCVSGDGPSGTLDSSSTAA